MKFRRKPPSDSATATADPRDFEFRPRPKSDAAAGLRQSPRIVAPSKVSRAALIVFRDSVQMAITLARYAAENRFDSPITCRRVTLATAFALRDPGSSIRRFSAAAWAPNTRPRSCARTRRQVRARVRIPKLLCFGLSRADAVPTSAQIDPLIEDRDMCRGMAYIAVDCDRV